MSERRRPTRAELDERDKAIAGAVGQAIGAALAAERKKQKRRHAILWLAVACAALLGVVF